MLSPPPAQTGLREVVIRDNSVDSHALLGDKPLQIRHGGEAYHLRITRQGKLILTK